jgi:hypothetical protein
MPTDVDTRVHLFARDGRWEVWLDSPGTARDGICIGVGTSYQGALNAALQQLFDRSMGLARLLDHADLSNERIAQ